jgi:4-amino-4-deoxy-L-arabinose transferase-like glycosyltransferase
MDERRPAGIPTPLLLVLAVAVALLHTRLYGLTFAEARVIDDARRFLSWLAGNATTADVWFGVERPSPPKILAAIGILAGGATPFAIRALPAALYALAAAAVYEAIRRPRGPVAAYAAVASLLLAPPFFALNALASNESVVTAFSLIALVSAARVNDDRDWISPGLLAGLACGTKISGLVILVALPLWALFERPSRVSLRGVGWYALAALAGVLVTWPLLPLRPHAVVEHIRLFAEMERPHALFFGPTIAPPWYYAPTWLVIGLPPLLLAASAYEFSRGTGPLTRLLRITAALGFAAAIASHAVLREGLRHLLPLAAVVALSAGLGLGRFVETIERRRRARIVVAVFHLSLLYSLVLTHPAESMYINTFAGGLRGAVRAGLPITASGDVLTPRILAGLAGGTYAVIPGPSADRALEFDNLSWREQMSRLATSLAARPVKFTNPNLAERLIVFGASRDDSNRLVSVGRPLLERDGVTHVSEMRNPLFERNPLSGR